MKGFALFLVILVFKTYAALHFIDQFGLNITYYVTFDSKCRNDEGRFRKILGIGLSDCVRECGLRPHCKALSYRGQMPMCDLFSTTDEGNFGKGACVYISGSDIKFAKTSCGKCLYGQVCDMHSKKCKYKECISTRIKNGKVLGNLNEVGSTIRYKCNHGYKDKNGIKSAVCQENGTWNVTVNCTRVCNDLPTIPNGTVDLAKMNGNFFMDTAIVTCDSGYQRSIGTITCTSSGDWENATCDPVACGDPPSIANGNVTLITGTLYMDTASVTCDMSYKASSNIITCTASGTWEMATCEDCYIGNVSNYSGTRNITKSGYACEIWDEHIGEYAEEIPESALLEMENYCRSLTGFHLWCFSSNDHKRELCNIPEC